MNPGRRNRFFWSVLLVMIGWVTSSSAQKFLKGELILPDSTLLTTELQKGCGAKSDVFDCLLAKDANGTERVFYPQDLKGFRFGKTTYVSLKINAGKTVTYLFAKQLQKGAAMLYLYKGKLFDGKEVYLFCKKEEAFYYVCFESTSLSKSQQNEAGGASAPPDILLRTQMDKLLQNLSDERMFKNQFLRYFSDCEEIVNKLKQDWYANGSITSLFEDYNHDCQGK